jgi:uncharacterized protein
MKFHSIILATALTLASGTAFAFGCPKAMKAIDEALAKNPKLTAEQMADVKKYRAEGERLHKESKAREDHQKSIDTLAKAQKILGI